MELAVKNPPASAGDVRDLGSIPGSGRSPGVANGNPLQSSCWENPMDREVWWATVYGVTKSWTRLEAKTYQVCEKQKVSWLKYDIINPIRRIMP